jgi:hypothetical protein
LYECLSGTSSQKLTRIGLWSEVRVAKVFTITV